MFYMLQHFPLHPGVKTVTNRYNTPCVGIGIVQNNSGIMGQNNQEMIGKIE